MSRAELHLVTGIGSADQSSAVRPPPRARDPRPAEAGEAGTIPPAGQPGHGLTASLRRQPVHLGEGWVEGGCTGAFEIICRDCGDHPDLDYSQVPRRLQRIRGPHPLDAGVEAYVQHLGLPT